MLNRFAHALLVLTSLAPVALVYGLSYLPTHPEVTLQWLAVALCLVVVCVGLLSLASKRGEREVLRPLQPKNVDKDVLAFLVSYALPLVAPTHSSSSGTAFWAFMALVAIVLYQAELVHVCRFLRCSAVHRPILLGLIPQPAGAAGGAAR